MEMGKIYYGFGCFSIYGMRNEIIFTLTQNISFLSCPTNRGAESLMMGKVVSKKMDLL